MYIARILENGPGDGVKLAPQGRREIYSPWALLSALKRVAVLDPALPPSFFVRFVTTQVFSHGWPRENSSNGITVVERAIAETNNEAGGIGASSSCLQNIQGCRMVEEQPQAPAEMLTPTSIFLTDAWEFSRSWQETKKGALARGRCLSVSVGRVRVRSAKRPKLVESSGTAKQSGGRGKGVSCRINGVRWDVKQTSHWERGAEPARLKGLLKLCRHLTESRCFSFETEPCPPIIRLAWVSGHRNCPRYMCMYLPEIPKMGDGFMHWSARNARTDPSPISFHSGDHGCSGERSSARHSARHHAEGCPSSHPSFDRYMYQDPMTGSALIQQQHKREATILEEVPLTFRRHFGVTRKIILGNRARTWEGGGTILHGLAAGKPLGRTAPLPLRMWRDVIYGCGTKLRSPMSRLFSTDQGTSPSGRAGIIDGINPLNQLVLTG
ncbi:hypothetical protein QBC44DRAFT_313195 [Cladorrhinum sp. PSN332]|nr:hypothetical protein QBC44DRAFT_313195 [Cladorrhinum sp. PSN332]